MRKIVSVFMIFFMLLSLIACTTPTKEEPKPSTEETTVSDAVEPAISAVITPEPTPDQSKETLEELNRTISARREAIQSSPTTITHSDTYIQGETYTGKGYYISNGGDNNNDGLTPETAFATPKALRKVTPEYGDAIFFERGGIWRAEESLFPGNVLETQGLTVSAYGEGDKPKIYASPENGTGAENWELFFEDESGKKIWKYAKDMSEVASIVINGTDVVERDVAFWDGERYLALDQDMQPTQNEYNVSEYLEDMHCFPELRYSHSGKDIRIFIKKYTEDGAENELGTLYFRCDQGNPGEIFGDIEFIYPYPFADGIAEYRVYDNLCIMYSSFGLCTGSNNGKSQGNCMIQNCEVGWIGGAVVNYATLDQTGDLRVQLNMRSFGQNGGCIAINGSNCSVLNCYIHNSFQEGISIETFPGDPSIQNDVLRGNLIEDSVQAILLCNWDMEIDPNHLLDSCTVEDNIVVGCGEQNWYKNKEWASYDSVAFTFQGGPCAHYGEISVRNNIFALSADSLIAIGEYSEEFSKVFSDNTYIQYDDQTKHVLRLANQEIWYGMDKQDTIADMLGDSTAKFGVVPIEGEGN